MEITYTIIVYFVTLAAGAINKAFWENMPNKYIPLQNLIIGVLAGALCYFFAVEPILWKSIVLCSFSAMGAGGTVELTKIGK